MGCPICNGCRLPDGRPRLIPARQPVVVSKREPHRRAYARYARSHDGPTNSWAHRSSPIRSPHGQHADSSVPVYSTRRVGWNRGAVVLDSDAQIHSGYGCSRREARECFGEIQWGCIMRTPRVIALAT
jgi:hypothetical protein